MPRVIDPALRACLERANQLTDVRVEIGAPDVGQVYRRGAELVTPGTAPCVSLTPAASLVAAPSGALQLAGTGQTLTNLAGAQSWFGLNPDSPQRRLKGLGLQLDPAFGRGRLRTFTANVTRQQFFGSYYYPMDFELQIYRAVGTPGLLRNADGTVAGTFTEWNFVPLLSPAAPLRDSQISWAGGSGTLSFDLSAYQLELASDPAARGTLDPTGGTQQLGVYYFVLRCAKTTDNDLWRWSLDTASARTIAGVGTVQRRWWARERDDAQWVETRYNDCPAHALVIDSYAPAGGQAQAVYSVDLGAAPEAASTTRAVFERSLPAGTGATLELSAAGSGGPWTALTDGDDLVAKGIPIQQTYHLRLTLTPDAAHRMTPLVHAFGLEARAPVDVSAIATLTWPDRAIAIPWGPGSLAEGKVEVIRDGARDLADDATTLGSTQPATQLEADVYLTSPHPSVGRAAWLHLERMLVSNRIPDRERETFTLLSYAQRLKRKIPAREETVNTVHTVTAASSSQITVTPALVGTTPTGNEYDGQGYYLRVRSSSQAGVETGQLFAIAGNTGVDKLDFPAPGLPGLFAVGDQVEVHSGRMHTPRVEWVDWDPADVWWDLLSVRLGIPAERIGRAGRGTAGRAGLPPTALQRAGGDATLALRCKVTMAIDAGEDAGEEAVKLLQQVSALLGGATVEEGGQILFVQLFPLYAPNNGPMTVRPGNPLPAGQALPAFDERDYVRFDLTPALERRITECSCTYGVNHAAASPDTYPTSTTSVVDADAMHWLQRQDLDVEGLSAVPDEIARWCYNSADQGFYLATQLCTQVVRAGSTGLRTPTIEFVDEHPELVLGDRITVVLEGYTDYDPGSATVIKGRVAVTMTVVGLAGNGRQVTGFVLGLQDVRCGPPQLAGGQAGTQDAPLPTVTAQPPVPTITPVAEDETTLTLRYTGAVGAGGAGPLTWRRRIDDATAGTWSAAASFPAADEVIAKRLVMPRRVLLEVTDTATGLVSGVAFVVGAALPTHDPATGHLKPAIPLVGGGYVALTNDATNLHDLADDTTWKNKHAANLPRAAGSGVAVATVVANLTDESNLQAAIAVQRDVGDPEIVRLVRGGREGTCRNAATVTFDPAFAGVPVILLRGGVVSEPGNKWGTSAVVDGGSPSGAPVAGTRVYEELVALNPGPGSFVPRVRLRQKGTLTARNYDFSGTNIIAVGGTDLSAALAAGASVNDSYTIRLKGSITCRAAVLPPDTGFVSLTVTVVIEALPDGSTVSEVWRQSYSHSETTGSNSTRNWTATATVSRNGFNTSGRFRIKVISATQSGDGSGTFTVRGYVNASDGAYGVSYNTSSGDQFASKTPDADDSCNWAAIEVA